MSQPFLGEIRMFAGNFAPAGWAFCQGQLLSISQNTALFSLLGTSYGGNGSTNFALPDLRGRAPLSAGPSNAGGSTYFLGEAGGVEAVTLLTSELPAHVHAISPDASTGTANSHSPAGAVLAATASKDEMIYATGAGNVTTTGGSTTGVTGGSQPHTNMQPYLVVNFIIALQGIYPARN